MRTRSGTKAPEEPSAPVDSSPNPSKRGRKKKTAQIEEPKAAAVEEQQPVQDEEEAGRDDDSVPPALIPVDGEDAPYDPEQQANQEDQGSYEVQEDPAYDPSNPIYEQHPGQEGGHEEYEQEGYDAGHAYEGDDNGQYEEGQGGDEQQDGVPHQIEDDVAAEVDAYGDAPFEQPKEEGEGRSESRSLTKTPDPQEFFDDSSTTDDAVVLKREFGNRRAVEVSHMPHTFTKQVLEAELADLVPGLPYTSVHIVLPNDEGISRVSSARLVFRSPQDAITSVDRLKEAITARGRSFRVDMAPLDAFLFVSNLEHGVTDGELRKLFDQYGTVQRAFVMRDTSTGETKGYGFVEYVQRSEASEAKEKLASHKLRERSIRVDWVETSLKNTFSSLHSRTLFIDLLPRNFTSDDELRRVISSFGKVLFCKIAMSQGNSRGFAFADFVTHEDAWRAMKSLNARPHPEFPSMRFSFGNPSKLGSQILMKQSNEEREMRRFQGRRDYVKGPVRGATPAGFPFPNTRPSFMQPGYRPPLLGAAPPNMRPGFSGSGFRGPGGFRSPPNGMPRGGPSSFGPSRSPSTGRGGPRLNAPGPDRTRPPPPVPRTTFVPPPQPISHKGPGYGSAPNPALRSNSTVSVTPPKPQQDNTNNWAQKNSYDSTQRHGSFSSSNSYETKKPATLPASNQSYPVHPQRAQLHGADNRASTNYSAPPSQTPSYGSYDQQHGGPGGYHPVPPSNPTSVPSAYKAPNQYSNPQQSYSTYTNPTTNQQGANYGATPSYGAPANTSNPFAQTQDYSQTQPVGVGSSYLNQNATNYSSTNPQSGYDYSSYNSYNAQTTSYLQQGPSSSSTTYPQQQLGTSSNPYQQTYSQGTQQGNQTAYSQGANSYQQNTYPQAQPTQPANSYYGYPSASTSSSTNPFYGSTPGAQDYNTTAGYGPHYPTTPQGAPTAPAYGSTPGLNNPNRKYKDSPSPSPLHYVQPNLNTPNQSFVSPRQADTSPMSFPQNRGSQSLFTSPYTVPQNFGKPGLLPTPQRAGTYGARSFPERTPPQPQLGQKRSNPQNYVGQHMQGLSGSLIDKATKRKKF